jgi:hypothetical protein
VLEAAYQAHRERFVKGPPRPWRLHRAAWLNRPTIHTTTKEVLQQFVAGSCPKIVDSPLGLIGVGVGSAAHTVSHVVRHDLGGKPEVDIPLFAVLTVLLLASGLVRWRE